MEMGDFSNPPAERHSQVKKELQQILLTKTRDEWYEFFTKHDVCVGKVYDVPEVFSDPQVKHRNMAIELDHPQAGKVTHAGVAIKLSDTPGSVRAFAPSLGQHTDEILQNAGMTASQISELRAKKVV